MNEVPNNVPGPVQSSGHKLLIWGVVIILLIAAGVWAYFNLPKDNAQQANNQENTQQQNETPDNGMAPVQQPQANPETTISASPAMKTVKAGEIFTLDLVLDTGENKVNGVDVYALNFDPKLLQVVDSVTSKSGVQVEIGKILNTEAANMVDNKAGTVKLGMALIDGTAFTGNGTLATIKFRAITAGTAQVKIDFTPGSTRDTNAAYQGQDFLSAVTGSTITITQ